MVRHDPPLAEEPPQGLLHALHHGPKLRRHAHMRHHRHPVGSYRGPTPLWLGSVCGLGGGRGDGESGRGHQVMRTEGLPLGEAGVVAGGQKGLHTM